MIKNDTVLDTKPRVDSVTDTINKFGSIDKTGGGFQATTTTYNEATVTYNSTLQVYGGDDGLDGPPPQIYDVINL